MDSNTASHLVLGVIGLVAAIGAVSVIGAFWSLGRQGNRSD